MRIGHIELFVRNPAESRVFYEAILGFKVEAAQGQHVWLKLGDTEILLRQGKNPVESHRYANSGAGIVLYTDDLESTVTTLQSRGLVLKGDDGDGCPTFSDPDGHWFQIVNPNNHS